MSQRPPLDCRVSNTRLSHAFLAILLIVFCASSPANTETVYPLVLQGGRVIDPETGLDAIRNVAIANGRITAISETALAGDKTIDVTGKIVAPGFIDLHTHSPTKLGQDYQALDGVTTALELEIGSYPISDYGLDIRSQPRINFGSSAGYLSARVRLKQGIAVPDMTQKDSPTLVNFTGLLTALRSLYSYPNEGFTEKANASERHQLKTMIEEQLSKGALGIGLGLDYMSEGIDETELAMIFDLAAKHQAPLFIHIRRGINGDPSGLDEVLNHAKRSGASVHICHITHNAVKNIELFLAKVRDAQESGVDVTTEVLPYNAGSTSISAAVFKRDWQTIFGITHGDVEWAETGERLTESTFAQHLEESPNGAVIHHYLKESWTKIAIQEPGVIIVSDLLPMVSKDKKVAPHNGTFSKVLGRYVRDEKLLSLPNALAKISLLPAKRLENLAPAFKNKGRLQVGVDADITVFDPVTVIDQATYANPYQGPIGISHVLVNGVLVVDNGQLLETSFPGKLVSASPRQ